MRKLLMSALLVVAMTVVVSAQAPKKVGVIKLDPALDAIVSSNAKVEVLSEEFFTLGEGPIWIKDGNYLLLSDIGANKIYKWTPDGKISVFQDNTGFAGENATQVLGSLGYLSSYNGRMYTGGFGSNGITMDPQGRLAWTAQGDRAIIRLEKDGKTRTTMADKYEGKRLNRPNDLVAKSDGWIYFTDPGGGNGRPGQELGFAGVYRVKDPGKPELLDKNPAINGIVFSPDEKYLYVGGGGKMTKYDVKPDGTIANGQPFGTGGCDGMKVDTKGNVFCAGEGGIQIFSPAGKKLGTIQCPEGGGVTNLAFGDADGKALYITVKRILVRVRLNTTGFKTS